MPGWSNNGLIPDNVPKKQGFLPSVAGAEGRPVQSRDCWVGIEGL